MKTNISNSKIKFIARIRTPIDNIDAKLSNSHHNYSPKKANNSIVMNNSYKSTTENINNVNQTVFTTVEQTGKVIITQKPLNSKFITTNLINNNDLEENKNLLSSQYNANIFEYDYVYTDGHSLDTIYIDQIKSVILNMFLGKNSCVLLFGQSCSGKSYILKGEKDNGVLARGVQEIVNLIEMNSSVDNTKHFIFKIGSYIIYNDAIFDLYSNDLNSLADSNKNIEEINKIPIDNKNDFLNCYYRALDKWDSLFQNKLVSAHCNLVFTFFLEDTKQKQISQIDFVELASSEYGLPNNIGEYFIDVGMKDMKFNQDFSTIKKNSFSKFLSNDFNCLGSNIFSSCSNNYPDGDNNTILTNALKNTLNPQENNQILFFVCLIPNQIPPTDAYKVLKVRLYIKLVY